MSVSDERQPESRVTVYTYESGGGLASIEELTGEEFQRRQDPLEASDDPPPFRFEHDRAARVFRLTAADGTVEVFHDNPTRYLRVEPDPQTGSMRPVKKHGRPVYLYLCRDEREAR